jgi:hypothetical protein
MKALAYLTPAFIRSHHTYENHRGVSMAEPAKNRMRDNVSEPLDRACGCKRPLRGGFSPSPYDTAFSEGFGSFPVL